MAAKQSVKAAVRDAKAASAIHKEAKEKASTLPKPGVPDVGAYAHLTKK